MSESLLTPEPDVFEKPRRDARRPVLARVYCAFTFILPPYELRALIAARDARLDPGFSIRRTAGDAGPLMYRVWRHTGAQPVCKRKAFRSGK